MNETHLIDLCGLADRHDEAVKYLQARDYASFLFLCERRYRWLALQFITACNLSAGSELAGLFHSAWIDSELLPAERDLFSLIEVVAPVSPKAFSSGDLGVFDALPDPFTVYRGFGPRSTRRHRVSTKPHNGRGRSWTLSLDRARWFAARFGGSDGVVASRSVSKSESLFYTNERKEQEIVLIKPAIGQVM